MGGTALDFGYPMSHDVGLRTPGVEEQVGRPSWWRSPAGRRFKKVLGTVLMIASPGAGFLPRPWNLPIVLAGTTVALTLLVMGSIPRPTVRSVLSVYRWEVWPAIVEVIGVPDARGNALVVFTLLRPDGHPNDGIRLEVHWPPQAHTRLRRLDRVEVWFAGDLRFAGVTALPGGLHPAMATVGGYGVPARSVAGDEVARRAGFHVLPR